ncbi:MAG: histone deacetylase [Burkholderiaceae bacterium]|nr:histone deacetylase [Burkholderiaceae bacterium]
MEKYRLLRDLVATYSDIELIEPAAATNQDLLRAHDVDYIEAVTQGKLSEAQVREIGFPWTEAMVERSRRSAGATIAACLSALTEGVSVNLAGGTHHAYADKGSGFCVFNDAAVAARYVQALQPTRVAVIDLDVHQGNGTAAILGRDSSCFTLSLHGEKNFPFRKEDSHLDIGLPDGCGDDEYLKILQDALIELERRFTPELIIYLAGADPHEGDRLGRLKLTMHGMAERDRLVLGFARELRCPIAIAMAGGYGRNIQTTVDVHHQTIQLALQYHQQINSKVHQ